MKIEVTPWPSNAEVKRKSDRRFSAELVSGYIAQCPFCGGDGQLEHTHTAAYWIECIGCGAQVDGLWTGSASSSSDHIRSARSAITAWNRRAENAT